MLYSTHPGRLLVKARVVRTLAETIRAVFLWVDGGVVINTPIEIQDSLKFFSDAPRPLTGQGQGCTHPGQNHTHGVWAQTTRAAFDWVADDRFLVNAGVASGQSDSGVARPVSIQMYHDRQAKTMEAE